MNLELDGRGVADVVIVGAGVAGLAAADRLRATGARTIVLEARSVVGGRIMSTDLAGERVDVGAGYLHGSATAAWHYVEAGGLRTRRVRGTAMSSSSEGELSSYMLRQRQSARGASCTVRDGLRSLGIDGEALAFAEASFAESGVVPTELGFDEILRENALVAVDQDADHAVVGGLGLLAESMAEPLRSDLCLGVVVEAVRWGAGKVVVVARSGEHRRELRAPHVLITVPIGALASEAIHFDPPLPEHFRVDLSSVLLADHVQLHVLLGADVDPKHPGLGVNGPIVARRSGPSRLSLHGMGSGARAIVGGLDAPGRVIASVLGEAVPVEAFACFDFLSSPLFGCAYGRTAPGGERARSRLGVPLGGKLFFAGEAFAAPGSRTTIHGAIETGWLAAAQIVGATADPEGAADAFS